VTAHQQQNARAVRIVEVEPIFSVEQSGGAFGLGAVTIGNLTFAHVRVVIESRDGRHAEGWGAILLSWPWAFPGDDWHGTTKDALMRALVAEYGEVLESRREHGHPIDHFLAIEAGLDRITAKVATTMGIVEPVPPLCALVSYSPIDAAIHDAYGNLHNTNSFDTLTEDHLGWDLSRVLGDAFAGKYPADYLRSVPVRRVPIAHTVGALDPVTPDEASEDAIPPLTAWIQRDAPFAFKVKLKGQDLDWDVQRLVDVYCLATNTRRRNDDIVLYGDLNEQGPSKEYIVELLDRLEGDHYMVYRALDMLEQPMKRDFSGESPNLTDVSARVPIVLDEGLMSLGTIDRALELGWGGIALKTCKTQSLMMLSVPKAIEAGMHISVQDLTNPGLALVQSVGIASRLQVTRPFETNVQQYFPEASVPEAEMFPRAFRSEGGEVTTEGITGPGLGYRIAENRREIFRR
jgi:L-alanine-DL-glutamate epimerase-like enolase superfamily enzyme